MATADVLRNIVPLWLAAGFADSLHKPRARLLPPRLVGTISRVLSPPRLHIAVLPTHDRASPRAASRTAMRRAAPSVSDAAVIAGVETGASLTFRKFKNMSAMGHLRRFRPIRATFALCPIATG